MYRFLQSLASASRGYFALDMRLDVVSRGALTRCSAVLREMDSLLDVPSQNGAQGVSLYPQRIGGGGAGERGVTRGAALA